MKIPSDCPICHQFLLNKYIQDANQIDVLKKKCFRSPTHNIEYTSLPNQDDSLKSITLTTFNKLEISHFKWDFQLKEFTIRFPKGNFTQEIKHLPFFIPNLSNLPTLISKIKKYLIFS